MFTFADAPFPKVKPKQAKKAPSRKASTSESEIALPNSYSESTAVFTTTAEESGDTITFTSTEEEASSGSETSIESPLLFTRCELFLSPDQFFQLF